MLFSGAVRAVIVVVVVVLGREEKMCVYSEREKVRDAAKHTICKMCVCCLQGWLAVFSTAAR